MLVCSPCVLQTGVISERVRCFTLAVIVGVLLLVVIRAQYLLLLLRERRICLAWLRATCTTMWLWSVWRGGRKKANKPRQLNTNVKTGLAFDFQKMLLRYGV